MDLREVTGDDVERVRNLARDSLSASYGHVLDDDVIEGAVDEWYDENLDGDLADDDAVYLAVEDGGKIAAFSQSYLVGENRTIGEIAWLHVDPWRRGEGIGARLLEGTERALVDRGATEFVGRVLAANEDGADFYEAHGYEGGDDREVRIGEETFVERTFVKLPGGGASETVPMEPRELPGGTTVYIAYDESDRASSGPFYATYLDEDREERYGWFCGNCESFDVAMDAMGRAECSNCGNKRKPTRWDASYG